MRLSGTLLWVLLLSSVLIAFLPEPQVFAASEQLIDSYWSDTPNSWNGLWAVHPSLTTARSGHGQCFYSPAAYTLSRATFQIWLNYTGTPKPLLRAALYRMNTSRTYGNNGNPEFPFIALAYSASLNITEETSQKINFTFSGYVMAAGYYCITVEGLGGIDASNYIGVGMSLNGVHAGNRISYYDDWWYAFPTYDCHFYVYGVPYSISAFIVSGLAPQKVTEVFNANPTRDTYQRKVFYDGTNFFLSFYDAKPSYYNNITYTSSSNGISWTSPALLYALGSTTSLYAGGNIDVGYPNRGAKDGSGKSVHLAIMYATSGGTVTWRPYNISGQTLVAGTPLAQGGQATPQGGSIVNNLDGTSDYAIYHRDTTYQYVRTIRFPSNTYDGEVALSYGNTTTGGNQLLPYKTSSPYRMLVLCKGGDNKLYYNIVNEPTATFNLSFTEVATLGTGFSDFCACSEAQNIGDPEIIHLVYIKSSGELCYRKFENDAWNSETVLVASGSSYPIIASGKLGRKYVLYVKDGKIWVKHFDGIVWLSEIEFFTGEHTYDNPTYLSSSGNVQDERISVVWTEGTGSPYEVWFSYLSDEPQQAGFTVKGQAGEVLSSCTSIDDLKVNPKSIKLILNGAGATWINITFPKVNVTAIVVYVNKDKATATITANSTHYFIYLLIHLSSLDFELMFDATVSEAVRIAAPHIYAAITIWSLALIIGVAVVLSKDFNSFNAEDLIAIIFLGIGILIVLFISLAVLSGFLNL